MADSYESRSSSSSSDEDNVTGYTEQQSHYHTYHGGSASCRDGVKRKNPKQCQHGDWHYDNAAGCGGVARPVCSRVDPHVCPTIDGTEANSHFDEAPKVVCSYSKKSFKSAKGLETWKSKFGENEQYQTRIMPTFCSQPSVNCPVDKKTGKPMKSCSRFNDLGKEGKLCRKWQKNYPREAKRIQKVYCELFKTGDCIMSDNHDNRRDNHHYDDDDDGRGRRQRKSKDRDCDKKCDKKCDDSGLFGGGVFIFFIVILLIIIIVAAAAAGRRRR